MVGTKVNGLSVFDVQPLGIMCAVILRNEASSSIRRCVHDCLSADGCVQVYWHPERRVCHIGGHCHLSGTKTFFDAGFQVMNLS